MTRYLWLSVPLCCAVLWSACTPPTNCAVNADCFPDEQCVANECVLKETTDGGRETGGGAGGGSGSDAGETGGGAATGGGPSTGGGTATGGGAATGGGEAVDAGPTDCETGETQPCCNGRGEQLCAGGVWSLCDATVSVESCNGVDDDCNGTVDNDVYFSLADGGVAMNVSCTVGVGACEATGSLACAVDGGVVCGAQTIQPTTEVCDEIDNDCDGEIDEGTKVLCLVDADNDHYAGNSVQQELCADTTRPDFGNCPAGYVASSLGVDCNDSDAVKFLMVSVRTDADNDSYCATGSPEDVCTDGSAPAGKRLANTCNAAVDCSDSDAALYQLLTARPDSDNDGACSGATTMVCSGALLPTGYRAPASCSAEDDCAPTTASAFKLGNVRVDADNDKHCIGASSVQCIGGGATYFQYRTTSTCEAPDDCDDSTGAYYRSMGNMYLDADNDQACTGTAQTMCVGGIAIRGTYKHSDFCTKGLNDCDDSASSGANVYRTVSLRTDSDGDQYCVGTATNYCIGATVPAGLRTASSCNAAGNDCRDNNANVDNECVKTVMSDQQTKWCGTNPVNETLTFHHSCPVGYFSSFAAPVRSSSNCIDGSCTYASDGPSLLNATSFSAIFTCEFAASGHDDWKLLVSCVAP